MHAYPSGKVRHGTASQRSYSGSKRREKKGKRVVGEAQEGMNTYQSGVRARADWGLGIGPRVLGKDPRNYIKTAAEIHMQNVELIGKKFQEKEEEEGRPDVQAADSHQAASSLALPDSYGESVCEGMTLDSRARAREKDPRPPQPLAAPQPEPSLDLSPAAAASAAPVSPHSPAAPDVEESIGRAEEVGIDDLPSEMGRAPPAASPAPRSPSPLPEDPPPMEPPAPTEPPALREYVEEEPLERKLYVEINLYRTSVDLRVTVERGTLEHDSFRPKPSPFCSVILGPRRFDTKQLIGTVEPLWEEELPRFGLTGMGGRVLEVLVVHRDPAEGIREEILLKGRISLDTVPMGTSVWMVGSPVRDTSPEAAVPLPPSPEPTPVRQTDAVSPTVSPPTQAQPTLEPALLEPTKVDKGEGMADGAETDEAAAGSQAAGPPGGFATFNSDSLRAKAILLGENLGFENRSTSGMSADEINDFWVFFWEFTRARAFSIPSGGQTFHWGAQKTYLWHQILRIDPIEFLRQLGGNWGPDGVVGELLRGVRIGILSMHFNVECPACGGCLGEAGEVGELEEVYTCGWCGDECEVDLTGGVSVLFSLAPDIYSCMVGGSPGGNFEAIKEAEVFSMNVLPQGPTAAKGLFEAPGEYVAIDLFSGCRTHITVCRPRIQVAEQRVDIDVSAQGISPNKIAVRPGMVRFNATSTHDKLVSLVVYPSSTPFVLPTRLLPERYTAGRLLHSPHWASLPPAAGGAQAGGKICLPLGRSLGFGKVVLLLVDLANSTGLCGRLGDRQAFGVFSEAAGVVSENASRFGGRVNGCIGDRCLVTLLDIGAAIKLALDIMLDIYTLNTHKRAPGSAVKLRIVLHAGHARISAPEGRTDLFGSAVNVGFQTIPLLEENEIGMLDPLFSTTACQETLKRVGDGSAARRDESEVAKMVAATEGGGEAPSGTDPEPAAASPSKVELTRICKTCRVKGAIGLQDLHRLRMPQFFSYP